MYQCTSFYTANRILPADCNVVVAAWAVRADGAYSYDMSEDTLFQPNMYCFIRTIEGEGILKTVNGILHLPQNTYLILPRKDILQYKTHGKIWIYNWVDFIFHGSASISVGERFYAEYTQKEKQLFEELLEAGIQHPNEILYINGIFSHCFYALHLSRKTHAAPKKSTVQFSEMCAFIEQKLYARLHIQEIAEFFEVSPRRIHQIFYDNTGSSPKQYISDLKMQKAKQLLTQTSVCVADIADVLGYNSPYHFSAAFKQAVGCAPQFYRRSHNTQ